MPNIDWKIWALAAALLGVLSTWGSREYIWTKTSETTTKTIEALQTEKATLKNEKSQLESRANSGAESTEETIPVQLPNGQVHMMTRKTSRTFQEVIQKIQTESQTKIAELERRLTEATATSRTAEADSAKSAPRWAISADVPLLGLQDISKYRGRAATNLGPYSVGVAHDIAPVFFPYLTAGFQF